MTQLNKDTPTTLQLQFTTDPKDIEHHLKLNLREDYEY